MESAPHAASGHISEPPLMYAAKLGWLYTDVVVFVSRDNKTTHMLPGTLTCEVITLIPVAACFVRPWNEANCF